MSEINKQKESKTTKKKKVSWNEMLDIFEKGL